MMCFSTNISPKHLHGTYIWLRKAVNKTVFIKNFLDRLIELKKLPVKYRAKLDSFICCCCCCCPYITTRQLQEFYFCLPFFIRAVQTNNYIVCTQLPFWVGLADFTVCRFNLRRRAWQKRGWVVFLRGVGDTPMRTMNQLLQLTVTLV